MTTARDKKIIAIYLEGKISQRGIGAWFGISGQTVGLIIDRAGVPKRPPISGLRALNGPPLKPENDRIAAYVETYGVSYGEAAKKLGFTRNKVAGAVWRAKRRGGLAR